MMMIMNKKECMWHYANIRWINQSINQSINCRSKSDKVDLDVKPSDDMKFHLNERYGYQLEPAEDGEPELYDDEYDDTYDTNNVGAFDADSADELTARR
jgi:hypothetical protein